jgi:drug/metabolite transporter (DMT)-like permease
MPYLGEIAALATAILWSGTSIAFSEASIRVNTVYVNITRMAIAILCLGITMLIFNIEIDLSFSQIMFLSISGFVGLVVGDTFLFKAYQNIGARLGMLIMALAPAIAAFLAFLFLGEKISFLSILGIIITIAGIAVVVFERQEIPSSKYKIDKAGIFYAFMGAVGQAVGLIFAKFAMNEGAINGFTASFMRLFSAVIILYPMAALAKKFQKPVAVFSKNKKAFVYTVVGSILGPFLGITLSMISITYAKVGIASTLMATSPIIMLPMVKYYYKENLSWKSVLGAFIAVGGIAMLFLI